MHELHRALAPGPPSNRPAGRRGGQGSKALVAGGRRSQIAIIDEHGELTLSRRIVNHPDTFREVLGDPEATPVALEATYGWEWLAELLEEAGYDVQLGQEPCARPARQAGHPAEPTDLFGKAARAFLTTLELPDGPRQRLTACCR